VVAGLPCPDSVHAQYITTGPDGKTYPTWHPPVDPASGCRFDHEHGDDPRASKANASLPPFGYIGNLIGDAEPHAGFKVFVAPRGAVNDEGRTALVDSRIVFHQGTGGAKRFSTQFHSLMYDVVAPDGHAVHLQGMADTGKASTLCDPRAAPGRVFQAPPSVCPTDSFYEIWAETLRIRNGSSDLASVSVSTAVFDPITVFNPSDPSQLLYTSDIFGGGYGGCDREAYHGPVFWYNKTGPTSYQTDAYGQVQAGGPLRQQISNHSDIGIPFTSDQSQFKFRKSQCVPGLGLSN
jgi:hypothetical protein